MSKKEEKKGEEDSCFGHLELLSVRMSEKEKEGEEDSCFGHLEFWGFSSLFQFLNSKMSNWQAITKNLLTLRRREIDVGPSKYEKTLHHFCKLIITHSKNNW